MADKKDLKKFKNGIRLEPSAAPANPDKGTTYVDTSGNLQLHDGTVFNSYGRVITLTSSAEVTAWTPREGDVVTIYYDPGDGVHIDLSSKTINHCTVINDCSRASSQVIIGNALNSNFLQKHTNTSSFRFHKEFASLSYCNVWNTNSHLYFASGDGEYYAGGASTGVTGCNFYTKTYTMSIGNTNMIFDIIFTNCTFDTILDINNDASYECEFVSCTFNKSITISSENTTRFLQCNLLTEPTYAGGVTTAVYTDTIMREDFAVKITSPSDGDILTYESSSGLWKNEAP